MTFVEQKVSKTQAFADRLRVEHVERGAWGSVSNRWVILCWGKTK